MGEVNSYGESRASERGLGSMRARRGEQPAVKNGWIPALLRATPRIERMSCKGALADGEDSNSRYPIGPKLQVRGSVDKQAAVAKSLVLRVSGSSSRYASEIRNAS